MSDAGVIRALVIEDDRAVARMLRVHLASEGLEVDVASHGEEALEAAEAATPDVVILDLQMPVMDGRTFYREFRRRGFGSPVIIVSAYNAEVARVELGAEGALDKPCDPDALTRLIVKVVGK